MASTAQNVNPEREAYIQAKIEEYKRRDGRLLFKEEKLAILITRQKKCRMVGWLSIIQDSGNICPCYDCFNCNCNSDWAWFVNLNFGD